MEKLTEPQQWLQRYGTALFRYALLRVGEREVAEDLVQETLLAAWRGHERFGGQSTEQTWLTGILKHKIVDHYRRHRHEQRHEDIDAVIRKQEQQFDEHGHWAVDVQEWQHPEQALDQQRFREVLQRCIEALPGRLGEAFILREFQDMSNDELCKVLEISTTNNLWVMLSRARHRLRDCLDSNWFHRDNREPS